LLLSTPGTRLTNVNVNATFLKLVARAGLAPRSGACRPRPHDYADLRVMPTREEKPCSQGVIVATESA